MAFAHFRMLIHKILIKDAYIVPESSPLIILDNKYDMCIDKNGKDTKHTRYIDRSVHLVINGKNCKIHQIEWCKGCQKLAPIATKNVGENY